MHGSQTSPLHNVSNHSRGTNQRSAVMYRSDPRRRQHILETAREAYRRRSICFGGTRGFHRFLGCCRKTTSVQLVPDRAKTECGSFDSRRDSPERERTLPSSSVQAIEDPKRWGRGLDS